MPEPGDLGQLKTQEWQHLQDLADQLEVALSQADTVDLSRFLPPVGTPQRLVYLHELIKTEMEIRCRRRKTVSLDDYVQRYPELGSAATLPAELIYEEFRVRHRHGDKPALDLYRQRFPAQFEQLRNLEKKDPIATVYNTGTPKTAPPSTDRRSDPKPTVGPPVETLLPETLPPAPPIPTSLPPRSPRPATPAPGSNPSQILPPGAGYQLIERIGKGQFGEVYRGLSSGGVVVAIKRILRSIDDESCQRELKALEKLRELNHPFLLQTHDFYPFEDRLIIVMELADGSLRDRFKECKAAGLPGIPLDELLIYFIEAAEALDYLRQEKLSHRDIKPENLLRLKGHAKVADFGIAREQENTIDHTTHPAGTAAYMPPEMWRGEVNLHSDQYSLAATWYEMRTGRRIFSGKTQLEVAQQHLGETPNLSEVPLPEQTVLLRALAKKPEQRYPSCKEFVQDLVAAGATKPAAAPPPARRLTTLLLSVALTITASILLALLWKSFFTTRIEWKPVDWKPDSQAGTDKDLDGGTYYKRLVKHVGDEDVVLVLVKKEKPTDPKTFYIMEYKVWNKLYLQFANNAAEQDALQRYGDQNPGAVKNQWRVGAWAPKAGEMGRPDWDKLGVEGAQQRVPVVGVTVTEAYFCAAWLGGKLPTQKQWAKAAGADLDTPMADENILGPFKGRADDATDIGINLGLTGPLPVGEAKRDVSYCGCRDMAGNGKEWTRDVQQPAGEVVPIKSHQVQRDAQIIIMGQSYLELRPLTFKEMRKTRAQRYTEAEQETSFRVVLERE